MTKYFSKVKVLNLFLIQCNSESNQCLSKWNINHCEVALILLVPKREVFLLVSPYCRSHCSTPRYPFFLAVGNRSCSESLQEGSVKSVDGRGYLSLPFLEEGQSDCRCWWNQNLTCSSLKYVPLMSEVDTVLLSPDAHITFYKPEVHSFFFFNELFHLF